MSISKKFCEENLEILFKILASDCDYIIKTNIVISLGDLLHKFPKEVQTYTNKVYQNL
jgi:condensin complex subunit 1